MAIIWDKQGSWEDELNEKLADVVLSSDDPEEDLDDLEEDFYYSDDLSCEDEEQDETIEEPFKKSGRGFGN